MGSFPGICEIVEVKEELYSVQHSIGTYCPNSASSMGDKDRKPPVLRLGYKDSLEDYINQLFETINLKSSSKGLGFSHQVGTSPLGKNALKKPITVGLPRSPGISNSEPVSLKQALRDLCISKASEMAVMKRLSKSTGSPWASEAGRIKSLYKAVVIEPRHSGLIVDEGKGPMVEISLVPEDSKSNSFNKIPPHFQMPKMSSLNQSTVSSPRCTTATQYGIGTTSKQNETVSALMHLQVPKIKPSSQSAPSTPRFARATMQSGTGMTLMQNEVSTASRKVGTKTLKMELEQKEEHAPKSSPSSDTVGNMLELDKALPVSTKLSNKASGLKPGRKGRLQTVSSSSSSVNSNRVSKLARNNPHLGKPVMRNKNFVKKKFKQDLRSSACTSDTYNRVKNDLDHSTSQLVCQRCQCTLKNTSKASNVDSLASNCASLSADVSLGNVNSNASKHEFTLQNCNRSRNNIVKVKKNSKLREKGEFSQSSKSSLGENRSTSISGETNVSGSSSLKRPHMSKDVRWEAIRHVMMQHGALELTHFNLLKKLGSGDIGTVYLAELIGTNCLFAIKVMDIEFLATRKKTPRAQTEREILRVLDHPFLPTLYAQFTSDNLSCLVMEYCPSGDLHVLRQKQPCRSFPEPAARFYVAEVLLALEYLHMLGVVYRDLKPENILVREDGHIMLTDFDLSLRCTVSPTLLKSSSNVDPPRMSGPCTESKCIEPFCIEPSCQVPCFSPRFLPAAAKTRKLKADHAAWLRSLPQLVAEPSDARSNSFVGTHEYLAPEIIKGEGHGAAVDWWTFGIFLYELLYGKTPFKGPGNEETLANVVFQSLKFPDCPLVSFQARDLIRGLLVKEPENRLGTEKGAAEIKQHPFFEGLNWALIRCAIPPELPEFYNFGVPNMGFQEKKIKYLECKARGEHMEFELF